MVHRMIRRGLVLAPILAVLLGLFGSLEWAVSGVAGIAMTLANLWLAARIIGGVAERNPGLLLSAALASFFLGLLGLTGIALALRAADAVYFPVTGFVLIGSHLGLVLWEAAGAYDKVEPLEHAESRQHADDREHGEESTRTAVNVRS
jgi:hypothetical protein